MFEAYRVVGIKDPPVPKNKHTRDRENLDEAISIDLKGCKHVFTPAERTREHKMVDSDSSSYP
jgi:hypothetical protein